MADADAAAATLQATFRRRQMRLEARATRHGGLDAEEAAEFEALRSVASWSSAHLRVPDLLIEALLPPSDGAAGDGTAALRQIASLGEAEVEARLAAAGLSGLSRHLRAALEAVGA